MFLRIGSTYRNDIWQDNAQVIFEPQSHQQLKF